MVLNYHYHLGPYATEPRSAGGRTEAEIRREVAGALAGAGKYWAELNGMSSLSYSTRASLVRLRAALTLLSGPHSTTSDLQNLHLT